MPRFFVLLLCLLPLAALGADDRQRQVLAEIDRQVWTAFIEGVAAFDHARYAGVRSRASVFLDGKRLFDYQEYLGDAVQIMEPLQAAGRRVQMEVRFTERLTDGCQAFERGLLRSTMADASGAQLGRGYAHFDAVLRREADGWRILTERRSRTGDADADAAAFDAAQPMGVFEPFVAEAKGPSPEPADACSAS